MTHEEFIELKPTILKALRGSPRKPDELIDELVEQGLKDADIRDAVWWLIDEGRLSFSRGWKLEAIPQMEETSATK